MVSGGLSEDGGGGALPYLNMVGNFRLIEPRFDFQR